MSEDKEWPDLYINKITADLLRNNKNTYLEGYAHIVDDISTTRSDETQQQYVHISKLKLAQDKLAVAMDILRNSSEAGKLSMAKHVREAIEQIERMK